MNIEGSLHHKIDLARRELLDMGLRANPLLNFRPGAKSLNVVEEMARHVFDVLVTQKKTMRFLPIPEPYQQTAAEAKTTEDPPTLPPLSEYLQKQHGDSRFSDTWLQTSLIPEKLDTTLLKIENEAHTLLQEQGIEVLYLAIGFLTWFEDNNSATPRRAPLLLIPVTLRRTSAKEVFSITWTEADIESNLALAAKLKGEFRLQLPDLDDELSPEDYFQQVQEAISSQPRWQIEADTITLGLFSFGKFQMFNDLDPELWPEGKSLLDHPIINGLLGQGVTEDAGLLHKLDQHPALKAPEMLHLVKDADSSQTEAVLAVMQGANLVIQGPPGTGKSQTITNIISEGLAQGKKILFVAQKMAALEVVKQRLDESHLGDAVLELHSHKTTKKAFIDALRNTLDQGRPTTPNRVQEYSRLKVVRSQLNEYVEATGEPILNSGETYVQALGKQLKWKSLQKSQTQPQKIALPEINFAIMADWNRETLARAIGVTNSLAAHIREKGIPADNPFANSSRTSLSPQEQQQITSLTLTCLHELGTAVLESRSLSSAKHLPEATTLAAVEAIHRAATLIMAAPDLQGLSLHNNAWRQKKELVRQLVQTGTAMAATKIRQQDRFLSQAFEADLMPIKIGLTGRVDKWWRIFSSKYRAAKASYLALCKGLQQDKPTDWLHNIDELITWQEHHKKYQEHSTLGQTLFQSQWLNERADWVNLNTLSEWLIDLHEKIDRGDIPREIVQALENSGTNIDSEKRSLENFDKAINNLTSTLKSLLTTIGIDPEPHYDSLRTETFDKLEATLISWQTTAKLYDITHYNQIYKALAALNLHDLAEWGKSWTLEPEDLTVVLLTSYYGGLVNYAYNTKEPIHHFDRLTHERTLNEFVTIDKALFAFTKENLVNTLYEALPNKNAPGEMDIIRREMNKKRRHIPIRRLITEAGQAIQQIKPVFMMSPMSVATYLPQGNIEFDLVIFDEASQISAPDAFGAIARAKQIVVVGDSRQMPPSNFFGRALELDDDEAELSATADIESILSLMLAKGLPESMLRWHYRSRHHSLIALSNAEFYNNKLMVFPSPGIHPDATGLKLNVLDTVYDRGGSRANKLEARHIAEAVMHHAQLKPQLSLGVVAFSTAQRDAITLEVERLRRENPDLESFFSHHDNHAGSGEFFIKNLENVQGDERDVIYISVGYGRTATGKVSQNFGPLNKSGGERRLNVLITRARMAMEVFCNFTADDLLTTATSPLGLKAFKAFLKYAETGELEQSQETGKEADSPFEEEVHKAIAALGYEVEPQVGCNGFYIDLAVRDPQKPGRYILAVECDGASYHSSASARDRDRIRQSVLEGLGWRFHRIWSTDWFRNAIGEIERLKMAIERAVEYYKTLDDNILPAAHSEPTAQTVKAVQTEIVREEAAQEEHYRQSSAYVLANLNTAKLDGFESFDLIPKTALKQAIKRVIKTESPIHIQMLTSRLTTAAGFARVGAKIRRTIESAVASLADAGEIKINDDFLVSSQTVLIEPRDWSGLDKHYRKIEYVSDLELERAVELIVQDAYSIHLEDCLSASLSLIGFKRATPAIKTRLEGLIEQMIRDNRLALDNGRLKRI